MQCRAVLIAAIAAFAVSAPAPDAQARSARVSMVPNGSVLTCRTCHYSRGGPRNPFGIAVETHALVGDGVPSTRTVDWSAVAALDSDGDGFTNGQELGDPDGTWVIGDPAPPGPVSAPGDPDDVPEGAGGSPDAGTVPDAGAAADPEPNPAPDAGAAQESDAGGVPPSPFLTNGDESEADEGCATSRAPSSPTPVWIVVTLALFAFGARRQGAKSSSMMK
jgi:MYXO-CTERM domain-containing protein